MLMRFVHFHCWIDEALSATAAAAAFAAPITTTRTNDTQHCQRYTSCGNNVTRRSSNAKKIKNRGTDRAPARAKKIQDLLAARRCVAKIYPVEKKLEPSRGISAVVLVRLVRCLQLSKKKPNDAIKMNRYHARHCRHSGGVESHRQWAPVVCPW